MRCNFFSKEFKKSLHRNATKLFFVFFRRKKNKPRCSVYCFFILKERGINKLVKLFLPRS